MATKLHRIENAEFNFWTPVKYREHVITQTHKVMECIDNYFYLNGKVAVVVASPANNRCIDIQLQEDQPSLWLTILKVISYATLIIPAIMLIAKYVLRSRHVFNLIGVNTSKNPAIAKLLSNYRLADNAKTYSELMEKIYSDVPEPNDAQLKAFTANLQLLDEDRISDRILNVYEHQIVKGKRRDIWEDRFLKMTIATYDAIMRLEDEELATGKEILITALDSAFRHCSNRQSAEIERVYFQYVAPELLDAVQAAATPLETLIFELMKHRSKIRDEIVNRLCPDVHNAASHRYFRNELNEDIFYLPKPLLCAEDNHYENFAQKRKQGEIIAAFQKAYDNPNTIYDIFIGLIYPNAKEKFHFKPDMFTKWLEESGRMNADAFADEDMTTYKTEIPIAFLVEHGFLKK
jgi:Family of unknown function (DUF648)